MNTTPLNTRKQAKDILMTAYAVAYHAQVIVDEHDHRNGPRREQVNKIQPQAMIEALDNLILLVHALEVSA